MQLPECALRFILATLESGACPWPTPLSQAAATPTLHGSPPQAVAAGMMLAASSGMLLEADSLVSLAIKRERTVSSGSRALWVSGLADICWTSGKPLRRPKCHIRRRGALALRDVASCQAGGLFIRASEGLHGDDEEEARAVWPLSPPRAPRNLQESEIAALHEALVERRAPAQGVLGSPCSRLLCASFRNRQSTPKLGHHDMVSHLSFIRTVYSIFSDVSHGVARCWQSC